MAILREKRQYLYLVILGDSRVDEEGHSDEEGCIHHKMLAPACLMMAEESI